LNHLCPALKISPAAFAVAGMGGVVGGSTGAAMAAIVMIFEMTLDYTVIVPLTLTVAISYGVRRSVIRDSIYTRKLTMRGEPVPETLRADFQFSRRADSIMRPLSPEERAACLDTQPGCAAVKCVTVPGNAALAEVMAAMRGQDASVALVESRNGQNAKTGPQGAITRKQIVDVLADDLTEMF
jgi:CIC family chloride channel protein